MTAAILNRFRRETADHAMTVLHDDGLYRHVRFQRQVWRPPLAAPQRSSMYWFELITAPGSLIFQGDGDSFVFRRVEDMFEFFRGPVGDINPSYWGEKLTDGRDRVLKFNSEKFERRVKDAFVEACRDGGVPSGTGLALREDVLDLSDYEHEARRALNEFEHKGFRFYDTYEWDFDDYDWWFLWALHGIVWGIAQYDAAKATPAVAA